ncbi:hypothetical protein Gpo141_00004340 [Globisporangium polare]
MTEPMSRIENALATRISNSGGLGLPQPLRTNHLAQGGESSTLNTYEVVRLGYFIFGDATNMGKGSYLIAFDDWDLLTLMAPLRRLAHLWNHRVTVFPIEVKHGIGTITTEPVMLHIDDPRLQRIPW